MKNKFLDARTAKVIDDQIAKLLRGLGNPDPPLDLDAVRTLLKLDKQYYSSTDDGAVREFISRVKVGGKLLIEKPTRLLALIKKFDLKALYVPDRKRILLDSEVPKPKWRWNEAHEITHSVIPTHELLMHGDDLYCLSPDCHAQLENEANYGAGRLLFLQGVFEEFVKSSTVSFSLIHSAKKTFHNTMTSTLWRLVEALDGPAFGLVSSHPRRDKNNGSSARYFIRSRAAEEQFSCITEQDVLAMARSYCSYSTRGPLGESELLIRDDNGDEHVFLFESFHNGHETLTLVTYCGPRRISVSTPGLA